MKTFTKVYRGLISGLLFAVTVVLLVLTGASTTFLIGDWTEQVFLTHDSAVRNVLYFALFLGLLFGAKQLYVSKGESPPAESGKRFRVAQGCVLGVATLLALLWTVNNRIIPEQDQAFVFEAAGRYLSGDYSDFQAGGYMSMYPNQTGLFLLELVLVRVFGSHCFFALELLNGAAYVLSIWCLGCLARKLGAGNKAVLATELSALCFLPLLFYTTFLYGNLLGLCMSLWAMYFTLSYLDRQKWTDLLWSVLLIVAAAAVKNNYLIFMVAIVLHALAEALRKKNVRNALLALVVVLVYAVQSWGTTAALQKKTGGDLEHGVSTLAFVAMGLQVNPVKCDGWYNEFNKESYIAANFDPDKQSELAKQSISDSVNYLKSPGNATRFFLRKNASQWADPLFQSLWTSQVRQTRNERPGWLNKVLGKQGSTGLGQVLDVLQFWVYAGVVLYLVFARKDKRFFESLLLQITVLGGFVFHCFWEAKGQYTLSYYVLLLPLAVLGVRAFLNWLSEKVTHENFGKEGRGDLTKVCVFGAVLLLVLLLPLTHSFDCLSEGSAAFTAYLNS